MNKPLHVINVSDSSESGDLFGSFKPLEIGVHCRKLYPRFQALCSKSFSRKKNRGVLSMVAKAHDTEGWANFVKGVQFIADIGAAKDGDFQEHWIKVEELIRNDIVLYSILHSGLDSYVCTLCYIRV